MVETQGVINTEAKLPSSFEPIKPDKLWASKIQWGLILGYAFQILGYVITMKYVYIVELVSSLFFHIPLGRYISY